MSGSAFSVFGRVQQRLHTHLSADVDRTAEVIGKFDETLGPLTTHFYDEFSTFARTAFEQTTVGAGIDAQLEFRPYDPDNLYRSLRPVIVHSGRTQEVSRAGDGLGALATIAIFRAAARLNRGEGVLLVEEPEAWLHPHALRALDKALRAAEGDGVQVIMATHAPALIQPAHFDEVVVVRRSPRNSGPTVVTQVSASTFEGRRRARHPSLDITIEGIRQRYEHLFHIDQAEGFLSRGVLLVEGETESVLLPAVLSQRDVDLDRLGISVVNAEGKTKLDQFFDLFDAFGIPVFTVFDTDAISSKESDNQRWNRILTSMLTGAEDPTPGDRVETNWASLSPNMDAALNADLDDIEPGLADALRGAATLTYPGATKVVQTRHIVSELKTSGALATLPRINAVVSSIQRWLDSI